MIFPSASIVNSISSASKYPFGAAFSLIVYVPAFKLFITCGLVVDVQLSITFPFESSNSSFAPSISSPVVISCFDIGTLFVFSTSYIENSWTFPVSSITTFTSSAKLYPFGAFTSCSIYSPTGNLLIVYALFSDVNSATTSPWLSSNCNCAPFKISFVSRSFLVISTFV